jgi:superfamily II DNA or RNA helicase/HKD family nuclease
MELNEGLYERLVEVVDEISLSPKNSSLEPVSEVQVKKRLVLQALERALRGRITVTENDSDLEMVISEISKVLDVDFSRSDTGALQELRWVSQSPNLDRERFDKYRPITPISEQALFTNSKDEPRIDLELERELATSDRVEILVSFIKISGLRLLESQLIKLRDRGVPVRLITTTYMGATDKKAIDRLVNDLGVEVRIDLLPVSNRLHAKAWLFHRNSGFSTAYIGSSNMSYSALTTGSEWNVRLSQIKAPELFSKFQASFETYWESNDYRHYSTAEYGEALEEALARQSKQNITDPFLLPMLDVIARPHQIKMLDELEVARSVLGHSRNLVVAATGTGKTVLAALDYKRLIKPGEPRPTLLFVAHRQEILRQAMGTFRQVLGDSSFGELLVDGEKPKEWRFVFASIQSLRGSKLGEFKSEHFQHLIVDEFHHAEAPSYSSLFEQLDPVQVVGLTATPERTDGVDQIWQQVFGGRIATELRLWDALSQDLLAPFHYFGLGEELDYSQLPWVAGRYEAKALSNLITTNSFRNKKVLRELNNKVPDITRMKALIFCVSVDHANQVADEFSNLGIRTKAVTGTTENRGAIIQELRSGTIQAIATVDVFNEGVDIPEVDTIVLLRPTESPVVFLQQIGRGLRRSPGKDQVLILDFIGAHRAEYRVDTKFAALSGKTRSEVIQNLEQGFPYLPSGSAIQLDDLGREYVLSLMKRQIAPNWQRLVQEVKSEGIPQLQGFLEASRRDIFEIYKTSGKNWIAAVKEAGLINIEVSEQDTHLLKTIPRLLHVDDNVRLLGFAELISNDSRKWNDLSDSDKRLASMFFWNLFDDGKRPWDGVEWVSVDEALTAIRNSKAFRWELENIFDALRMRIKLKGIPFELVSGEHPFLLHATYSRAELLGGLGYARLPGNSVFEGGPRRTVKGAVTGVYFIPEAKLDLFFVNLQKADSISESIRYHDYAISPTLFHWDSQSATSVESETGQRYITQRGSGRDVLIAVREKATGPNGTVHFKLFGTADYVKHEGSKPISIWWQLRAPIDPDAFEMAAAAKVS